MADAKLTALTAASALAGADLFYVSQSAASRKATGTQLLALVGTTYVPLAGGTMTGALTLPAGAVGTPSLTFTGAGANTGLYSTGANDISFAINGAVAGYWGAGSLSFDTALVMLNDSGYVRFGAASGYDPVITRAGNGSLYLRTVATSMACAFHVSGLYTDASNYERLTLTGVAGTSVNITAETLGTGGDNLDIVLTPAGTGRVVIGNVGIYPSSGLVQVAQVDSSIYGSSLQLKAYTSEDVIFYEGSTVIGRFLAGGGLQLSERTAPSAPATNSVRIYAEDNGAGKTRLMALFATGSAVQLGIEP